MAHGDGLSIKKIIIFPGVGILCMWMFDVDYITQNSSYIQLLATLCVSTIVTWSTSNVHRTLCETNSWT